MRHIDTYKIFEIRGIHTPLISIADDILKRIRSGERKFIESYFLKGNIFKVEIIVLSDKEYKKERGEGEGVTHILKDDIFARIYFNDAYLNKTVVVHELKHVHSYIVSGQKKLKFNTQLHLIFDVISDSSRLFFNISPKELSMYLYILNSEELEAYYHSYWIDLEEKTKDMNPIEKRKFIKEYLDKKLIFDKLSEWKDGGFDLGSFFKSKKLMSHWFDMFRTNTPPNGVGHWYFFIKKLLNKDGTTYDGVIESINKEINKNCKKYYRKYMLLYTM